MRPRIKLRSNIIIAAVTLQMVLGTVKTGAQANLVITLLHRYGVSRPTDLLPEQVTPFTTELKAVLAGKAPDPNDSILDPSMMEMR